MVLTYLSVSTQYFKPNLASLNFNNRTNGNKTTGIFIKFLRDKLRNGQLKSFKKDEWSNIIEFLETHYDSISNYNEMESWPTMFDTFVAWVKD